MTRLRPFAVLIAALLLFTRSAPAADDSYPTRPIHLILGFAAGSIGDVAAIVGNSSQIAQANGNCGKSPGRQRHGGDRLCRARPKDDYTSVCHDSGYDQRDINARQGSQY